MKIKIKLTEEQINLITERDELVSRIIKLETFISSDDFKNFPLHEKNLFIKQHELMNDYNNILNERIGIFIK